MNNNSRFKPYRIFAAMLVISGVMASSHAATGLYTPNPSFNMADHVVSTSFFHWYTATAGQISGPWLPLEGRPAWTGEPDWWKGQIKQTMMANIDMLYVHLIPSTEQQRINLFIALNQLRDEGYDVPKIAPFLDPIITWNGQPNVNLATAAGKDAWVDQYIRFFTQYYSVNQDAYADDYIAKFDGQVILDSWHPHLNMDNISSLSRSEIMTRLQTAFGSNSVFSNDIYMVSTFHSPQNYAFTDEKTIQFEVHSYYEPKSYNGTTTAQVKPGYWDQNVRNPGTLLPRNGGSHYTAAWNSVNGNSALSRVYIESFNEYDEGSGIYAANPSTNFLTNGNTGSDTWSSSNDPYEYLYTTAAGAATFNDTPNHGAKILWHDFPASMAPGSTQMVSVVVRNTGDASWTAATDYKFGDMADGSALFGAPRYLIDDNADEIPIYGGIFRGRAKTFSVILIAPTTLGSYETHWGMIQEGVEWFGETLAHTITIEEVPVTVTLGDLQQTWDGDPKSVSVTTAPTGVMVEVTYDGTTTAPTGPDSYTVIGTVTQPDYQGAATNTFVIEMSAAYDAWRAEWFTEEQQTNNAVSGPEVYFDGDAFSNWEEYVAGTDPTDTQAFPTFDMQPMALNGYILSWASVSGRVYSIDWSTDLTQGFTPLAENILWPQSSYTDLTHQAATEGFYQMDVSLPGSTTHRTIIPGGAAFGVGSDLFQNAAITSHSAMHPAAGGFLSADMFSEGADIHSRDAIFADSTGTAFDFVEFNIASAVNLKKVVVGLANDPVAGVDNDLRSLNNIRVYASHSAGTVLDHLVADVAVDPEYSTAYGHNHIAVSIDLVAYGAQYFRVEFSKSNVNSGPRVFEVDGFAAE